MFNRILEPKLLNQLSSKKVIVLIGPRQVGKTTLIKSMLLKDKEYIFVNGDDPQSVEAFNNVGIARIKQLIGNAKIVFVDEAQRIPNIGLIAKMIYDELHEVKVILSGSSAFDLTQSVHEPLTGRALEYRLFPISWMEYQEKLGLLDALNNLENRLIYGFYPEVLMNGGDEKSVLAQLSSSYLYKDILEFGGIKRSELLIRILKALALQVGNEVSYNELAQVVQADKNTVINYIDLLEKVFVIFRLEPLSRNVRNEISTSRKIYFYDNGIRNAIIGAFQPLSLRNDVGALWENFFISERIKMKAYTKHFVSSYFWRSYQQQEVDYIEEENGDLTAFECKWNPKSKARFPKTFVDNYKPANTYKIDKNSFVDYLQI
jgi:predicted AAA+ superfamily ATPase